VEAILFDLDDTLIVDEEISKSAMEETARLAAKLHGADSGRFVIDARRISQALWLANPVLDYCNNIGITAEECLWGGFAGPSSDLTELRSWSMDFRTALFDAVLREQGLPGDDGLLAVHFADSRRKLQRLMPDARETLARLKPSFRIGLLTNGAPDLQREKIAASGLAPFFDAVAISGEHGVGKPGPEIFRILLDSLGVTAGGAAMVGNSLARDIAGAKRAGIALAIWLKVPGSEEYAEVTPNHTITGLHELPALLSSPNL